MTDGNTDRGALVHPRAILFDWDNTLVDVWGSIWRAYQVTAEAFGVEPYTFAESRRRVRHSMRDTFPAMFGERWREAAELFSRTYGDLHLDGVRPLDGSAALLEGLAGRGLYLGVVSNKQGRFLRAEAVHLGWDGHFGRLVGAGDAKRDKPAADPVFEALQGSGLRPASDIWFIGDALIDMECAAAAGCTAILITHDGSEVDDGAREKAHACVADCSALSHLVSSCGEAM